MIKRLLQGNGLVITLAVAAVLVLPALASLVASSKPIPTPRPPGVAFPANYRADFLHYATVQRPDGTIRELYIDPAALQGGSVSRLPEQTVIVIEGYDALRDESGDLKLDVNGHYTRGAEFPAVHVRMKRNDWSSTDFVSNLRAGDWNFASFDVLTGQPYDESINACFNCHAASGTEFMFSDDLLARYIATGETQYLICDQTGRTECSPNS